MSEHAHQRLDLLCRVYQVQLNGGKAISSRDIMMGQYVSLGCVIQESFCGITAVIVVVVRDYFFAQWCYFFLFFSYFSHSSLFSFHHMTKEKTIY